MTSLIPHPRKQLLFVLLSLADLSLTWWLVDRSGGQVYESNPLASWWLRSYGWFGLAGFKVGEVFLVLGLAVVIAHSRVRAGARILEFACTTLGFLVLYSVSLCGTVSRSPREGSPEAEREAAAGLADL